MEREAVRNELEFSVRPTRAHLRISICWFHWVRWLINLGSGNPQADPGSESQWINRVAEWCTEQGILHGAYPSLRKPLGTPLPWIRISQSFFQFLPVVAGSNCQSSVWYIMASTCKPSSSFFLILSPPVSSVFLHCSTSSFNALISSSSFSASLFVSLMKLNREKFWNSSPVIITVVNTEIHPLCKCHAYQLLCQQYPPVHLALLR